MVEQRGVEYLCDWLYKGVSAIFVKDFVKDGIKKEALRRVPERRKTEMKIVALFSKEPY